MPIDRLCTIIAVGYRKTLLDAEESGQGSFR